MNHIVQPLQFDVRKLIAKGRRTLNKRVKGAEVSLPGFTFSVEPVDPEVKVARQLVVSLGDRRVLHSSECCDDCINRSLASILKIREYLVQRQVELADLSDGVLFLLIEFIVQGLRQFLTHEERLKAQFGDQSHDLNSPDCYRAHILRESYFTALKSLRAHISGAAEQIATIAGISLHGIPSYLRVQSWDASSYLIE